MIRWTEDDLAVPQAREVVAEQRNGSTVYRFMHDMKPDRWYVTRHDGDSMKRTIVCTSRQAPFLQRAWEIITMGDEV